ncbi:hypothetical protein bcgnr5372_38060 [Bacillus luti]|nr:hypothetical protein [Bacillus cereus]HDR8327192.1 hypothetical protein [Bacillus cereus]HDR8337580.1 hypothetical protein [Bacillus cereus]
MSPNQMERTKELILEMQQGAVEWDLQNIKTILGGKYSKKFPELYNELLEILNNGCITVTVDKINYETKESLEEAQDHPDYIQMFERLDYNTSESRLLLDFSICKWLINRGELPHEIYSSNSLAHLMTDTSHFSVKIGNADIFQMLNFLIPDFKCTVHVVYTNEEIILFQFERTEKYVEWKRIKDEEFHNRISGNFGKLFTIYSPSVEK